MWRTRNPVIKKNDFDKAFSQNFVEMVQFFLYLILKLCFAMCLNHNVGSTYQSRSEEQLDFIDWETGVIDSKPKHFQDIGKFW